MENLAKQKCQPCEGIGQTLPKDKAQELLHSLQDWKIEASGKIISKDLVMKNFLAAVDLINKIAKVAEAENHHPDLHLTGYRKLKIELSTHALGGLSQNDFILAAKIDQLPAELKK